MLGYLVRLGVSRLREAAKRGNALALAFTGEARRSPHWHVVESAWRNRYPRCAACGRRELVQVHHVQPFHLHPELELADGTGRFCEVRDARHPSLFAVNLVTLCMNRGWECHLAIGHGGNFQRDNPHVLEDASELLRNPSHRELVLARAHAASLVG